MKRVGSMEEQELYDCQMATRASQRERSVVIVGGLPVSINKKKYINQ
jgi:hypothetical protein